MIVKIKRLHPDAVIPSTAKTGDAGYDLTAVSRELMQDGEVTYWNYEFGLSMEIPPGYVGLIFPRSSISKKDLMLTNSVGVIDSGYRGSLSARFKATNKFGVVPTVFEVGERVAQLVIVPYAICTFFEVGNLTESERGSGGFGSSGK